MNSKLIDLLNQILDPGYFSSLIAELNNLTNQVNWGLILKYTSLVFFTMILCGMLLFLNDRIFEYYSNRRVKRHKLTIRNEGNTASVYLLRTVNLPDTLAVRFRINGYPMIWLSQKLKETKNAEAASEQTAENSKNENQRWKSESGKDLVPNLSNPMDAVSATTKSISEVGKKAGFFASLFSNIANLLPWKTPGLSEAQQSLKGLQQNTSNLTGSINVKVNTANSLGDQLGKIVPKDKMGELVQTGQMEPSSLTNAVGVSDNMQAVQGSGGYDAMTQEANGIFGSTDVNSYDFVYDEKVWKNNIGKKDESGGSMNFAQTKKLEPGESMVIDVEIMNISDSAAAVSHFYKLEILQVPQSNLHLSIVSRYINGIVIFEKVSQLERILPPTIVLCMVIGVIQLIALYSYIIF
ncbi:MAG: hypothetical protein IKP86_13280 [Anaerolineaceae bacterium]|nr:hypothetical protein [Anaerolineaceae bacterium]